MIKTNRIKGNGIGETINFPTINSLVDKLPDGLSEGLWATYIQVKYTRYKSISLVSKLDDKYRIETHVIKSNINVEVGSDFTLTFIKKLREFSLMPNREEAIENDKKLASNFFNKTCFDCKLFYSSDYGYSNYTVEGTNYGCFANKFEEDKDDYIVKYNCHGCDTFSIGEYWNLDVDGETSRPSESLIKKEIRNARLKNLGI